MQQQFAEVEMKMVVEPARGAVFEGDGPEHGGEAAIEFRIESREMMPLRLLRQGCGFHGGNRSGSLQKAANKKA